MLEKKINPVRNKKSETSVISNGIKDEVKEAMKNKDIVKVMVLRGVLADFINELIAQKIKPQEEISDGLAMIVIKRAVKQRKDSIEQFAKGGREDLVQNEKAELEILEKYLPTMMNTEEIKKIAKIKKAELDINDESNLPAGRQGMGILIGATMGQIKSAGKEADGALVKKVIENLFS